MTHREAIEKLRELDRAGSQTQVLAGLREVLDSVDDEPCRWEQPNGCGGLAWIIGCSGQLITIWKFPTHCFCGRRVEVVE